MKYYDSKETATRYYLENNVLMGIPQMADGTWATDDAFEVWEHDEMLSEEELESGKTLGQIWAEARKELSK